MLPSQIHFIPFTQLSLSLLIWRPGSDVLLKAQNHKVPNCRSESSGDLEEEGWVVNVCLTQMLIHCSTWFIWPLNDCFGLSFFAIRGQPHDFHFGGLVCFYVLYNCCIIFYLKIQSMIYSIVNIIHRWLKLQFAVSANVYWTKHFWKSLKKMK